MKRGVCVVIVALVGPSCSIASLFDVGFIRCADDRACPENAVCQDGVCFRCDSDEDCAVDESCAGGRCTSIAQDEGDSEGERSP